MMIPWTEKITKIIPIISLNILISSIIQNSIYYSKFGINLSEYIDLSEFPSLFISDLMFYLSFIIVLLFPFPVVYITDFLRKKYGSKFFKMTRTKTFIIFIILLNIGRIFMIFNRGLFIGNNIFNAIISITIIVSLIPILVDRGIKFTTRLTFISSLLLMLIFSGINGLVKSKNITNNIDVKFKIDTKMIQTNRNLKYLGKTKNYIFIYNIKDKITSVYEFNKIENFKLLN